MVVQDGLGLRLLLLALRGQRVQQVLLERQEPQARLVLRVLQARQGRQAPQARVAVLEGLSKAVPLSRHRTSRWLGTYTLTLPPQRLQR